MVLRFPFASTCSIVHFHPLPACSIVTVLLLGGGPGLNVDFARLSFHVPTKGSRGWFCANVAGSSAATRTNAIRAETMLASFMRTSVPAENRDFNFAFGRVTL